ncbi:glycosyl transferase [Methanoculleus taiwanensis]|uniref:Glycosyl transferase n=1 Tax=Methanoculleus taiwanensis TaxID=1550565 RepID=A0A498GY57_9EURY|nr:glycosyltransferase family 39 protein [Methanoculleus taiwanensis]RXE55413.1 glycosyl transferase [Methanoculleus taiwanensis]
MILMKKKQGREKKEKPSSSNVFCDTTPGDGTAMEETSLPGRILTLAKTCPYMQMLAVLTAVGLLLRLYNLGYNSLWLDEASTLYFARQSLAGIWASTAGGEFNPPLFYWMEHIMLVFGNSEFILRLLPALLGVLTIPVFYFVGATFRDKNTGIIAAALLTFAPFHITYSQEARAYAPMLFFFALSLPFYFKALRTNDLSSWILFGILSSLAFWTHFYAFVPVGILLLFGLAAQAGELKKDLGQMKNLIIGGLAFVLASLPLIIVTAGLFVERTAAAPTYGIQSLPIIYETVRQVSGYNEFVMILFLVLFVVGTAFVWRDNKQGALLLITMMVLPLIVSLLLSTSMPMLPRYLIYLLPFYFVGIAASYQALFTVFPGKKAIYLFIVVIMLLSVPFLASYYTEYQKNDWRGFSAALGENTAAGDVVVVMPGYMHQPLNYYYDNTTDSTIEYGATTSQDLISIQDRHANTRTFYVVTGDLNAANPNGDALAWLQQNTRYAGQNMGIYLFVSP